MVNPERRVIREFSFTDQLCAIVVIQVEISCDDIHLILRKLRRGHKLHELHESYFFSMRVVLVPIVGIVIMEQIDESVFISNVKPNVLRAPFPLVASRICLNQPL